MVAVHFDLSHFRKKANEMGIFANDQLPFAIANTLNQAMLGPGGTREYIVKTTYPKSFRVYNRNFARAAFNVNKASKRMLMVELYDRLGRAHLDKHAQGGTKQGRGQLALPNWSEGRIRRTAAGSRPRPRKIQAPARALRVVKGRGIFVGEGGSLHALYWFRSSGKLKKRFPFYEDFAKVSIVRVNVLFPANIQRAVNTAFSR